MTLLMVLLLAWFALQSRRSSVEQQGPPAFFVERKEGIRVVFQDERSPPVVRQFSDETLPLAAILLTRDPTSILADELQKAHAPLQDGEALDLLVVGPQVVKIHRHWMPARWRMTLGIPLHPDRMNEFDWQALPGIGPKLAASIELDRQDNGDFLEFHRLQRVRGIGQKRMQAWAKYFSPAP
jgi:competence protein ComEA